MALSATDIFHNYLRSINIGEPSPFIPPNVSKYGDHIPNPEDLHPIPRDISNQEFQSTKYTKLDADEMKKEFVQYQIKHIASQIESGKVDQNVLHSTELDLNNQFTSVNNFIKFKQSLATYYEMQSEELELPVKIELCKCPQCLNNAIPKFQYCINHIHLDPKYSKQKFVSTCTHKKEDKTVCRTPCPENATLCQLHKISK